MPMTEADPISFRTWIMTRARITDTPAGDFIHDARRDPGFPEIRTRKQLIGYLRLRGACEESIQAAEPVWARWRDFRRRHGG
jgi:hypothetical protein